MKAITITVSYLRTSALSLCYDDDTLQRLCDCAAAEGNLSVLLSLPRDDARRVIAGLLPRPALSEWACNSAQRARGYAASASAASAAAASAHYAAYTHYADADADAAAAAAAARAAASAYAAAADATRDEHTLAVQDGARLLGLVALRSQE